MQKTGISSNEKKNFMVEVERFIEEHKKNNIKPDQGIIITNNGNRLICGDRGTVLSMITYLLHYLYQEDLVDDMDLDKIVEITKMTEEQIEKDMIKMSAMENMSKEDLNSILDNLKELADKLNIKLED